MLRIRNLDVSYGDLPALKKVSIQVEKNKIIAILGVNGAGKTTLLRTISGLEKPLSGEIEFEGKSLLGQEPHQITSLGIAHVPENRRIFTQLSVSDNLILGSVVKNAKQKRKENLEYVYSLFPRLYERRNQKGGTLSGGEQQMLAFGRALMLQPKLMMLDEPSLGLAPIIVEEVFNIIEQIHNEGVTILLVEQNAHLSLEIMQYGFVLENGEVALEGEQKVLMNSEFIREAYLGLEN